jgi:hypothetical protein
MTVMRKTKAKLLSLVTLLTLVAVWGGGEGNNRVMADASGCTRHVNRTPALSTCQWSPGSVCYYCEYSHSSGYTVCYEYEAGGGFCIDYQDIPPWPDF